MKLISWNVNGLRACIQKGFLERFDEFDADFVCLQETKLSEGQLILELPGYAQYWCYAQKKGYSGTAIFTKHIPQSVHYGLDVPELDTEGRLITLEYPEFYLVNCYTPNAQQELARIGHRMTWDEAFRAYLSRLDANKPVIVCGDLNVAHQEIDLKNPKSNRGSAGFSDQERDSFTKTLEMGLTDTFRYLHPDAKDRYSWWSYRFHAREKNAGWRIDYFLVSDRIRESVFRAEIYSDILGSDHCPVSLELDQLCNGSLLSFSAPGKARAVTPTESPKKGASADKAKALVPVAVLCLAVLCAAVLWISRSTTEDAPKNSPSDEDWCAVTVYDKTPWSYFSYNSYKLLSSSTLSKEYIFTYECVTETGSYYITDEIYGTTAEQNSIYDTNVLIRVELTGDAAPSSASELDPAVVRLASDHNPVSSVYIDVLDQWTYVYYTDPQCTVPGGWLICAKITAGPAPYILKLRLGDYRLEQSLTLTPAGMDIPTDLEEAFTVTDLSQYAAGIYEGYVVTTPSDESASPDGSVGDYSTCSYLYLNDLTFYAAPTAQEEQQVQNGRYWLLVTPDPTLLSTAGFDALTLSYAEGTLYTTEEDYDEIPGYFSLLRVLYSDPERTNPVAWLYYGNNIYVESVRFDLQWRSLAGIEISVETVKVSAVKYKTSTYALVDSILSDENVLLAYQDGYTAYEPLKTYSRYYCSQMAELAQREDAVEILMNSDFDPDDLDMINWLLKALRDQMTPDQEALYLMKWYSNSPDALKFLPLEDGVDVTSLSLSEFREVLSNNFNYNLVRYSCSTEVSQQLVCEYLLAESELLQDLLAQYFELDLSQDDFYQVCIQKLMNMRFIYGIDNIVDDDIIVDELPIEE